MSNKWKSCLIDEMITELAISRQSMAQQSNIISDIIDKSNNILLQIEATRGSTNNPNTNTNNSTKKTYTCKKETVQTLAKIIENAPQMFSANMQTLAAGLSQNSDQFEQYLEQSHQRAEYLSSCVRKLLAVGDTLTQIKTVVHEESDGDDDNSIALEPSSE
ncbi:uncharacterized protein LOC105216572 [Zeugodacus cucurbitae]|uniref:uncharacterized protein LOC105216572 n=1 Tax=Zeugodacus cucurbitae TaxID=28588 RepID=UPI0005969559|nr:uncharacterized protein LOC105216572 [Zeugodacus cucurbitae]